jgi:hypothetical protein
MGRTKMGYSDNKLLEFILEETRKSREVQVEMLKLLQKISADTKKNKEYLEEIHYFYLRQ